MSRAARVFPSLDHIAERLKGERERQGLTQRALARRVGLSASLISQIETGRSQPSVSTLYALVTELDISLDVLFENDAADPPAMSVSKTSRGKVGPPPGPVVRPIDRHAIELESGVRWERLTSGPEEDVDFLHVVYETGGASSSDGTLMRHSGREYGFVISGRLGVQIGFREHSLGPGDSIAFDSTQPHRLRNLGEEPVTALWCVVGRRW